MQYSCTYKFSILKYKKRNVVITTKVSIMSLNSTILFRNLKEEEIEEMKKQACIYTKTFQKGETILATGQYTNEVALVLEGCIRIENFDLWDNRSVLASIECGHVFAETYALCHIPLRVDAIAHSDSRILFLDLSILNQAHFVNKSWTLKIKENLLQISAQKNLLLSQRIFCTSAKTIRERVITYLSSMSKQKNAYLFKIPFNRMEMADYLNVDRTALSKELSRMQKEGLISYHKNTFKINLDK